jgi:small subunit ribosomal protein S6
VREYELMVIHRHDIDEPEVRAFVSDIEARINQSGAVESSDFWGKRRFAYEIDHMNEGYYSVVEFQSEPALVDEMDRVLSLADEVVRHKILRRADKES